MLRESVCSRYVDLPFALAVEDAAIVDGDDSAPASAPAATPLAGGALGEVTRAPAASMAQVPASKASQYTKLA